MAGAKRGLGRGLGALFGEDTIEEVIAEEKAADRKVANGAERVLEKNSAKPGKRNAEKSTEKGVNSQKHSDKNGKSEAENAKKSEVKPEQNTMKTSEQSVNSERMQNMEDSTEKALLQFKIKAVAEEPTQTELELKVSEIEPNRDQPRKTFDEAQLEELADSIRKYGVLQPLLVQKKGESYEIIAGERRWRAAKIAGLKTIPAVIREYSPQQAMEIALIENVQRADLNPIEEARAYQRLMQEFSLKQEEIAERVSKNRSTITNSMRLLNLIPEVQQMLVEGRITSGHARALLTVNDPSQQLELAQKIEQEHMSVREIEKAVKMLGKEKKEKKKSQVDEAVELVFLDMENRMKTVMGTKVNISRKDKSKGKVEIEYYSEAELERIVELIESIRPM